MMTEEETGSDNNYIRHRQSWQSRKFNSFLDKLDDCKNPKSLAKQRDIVREVPRNAKRWMILEQGEESESGTSTE